MEKIFIFYYDYNMYFGFLGYYLGVQTTVVLVTLAVSIDDILRSKDISRNEARIIARGKKSIIAKQYKESIIK